MIKNKKTHFLAKVSFINNKIHSFSPRLCATYITLIIDLSFSFLS